MNYIGNRQQNRQVEIIGEVKEMDNEKRPESDAKIKHKALLDKWKAKHRPKEKKEKED